MADNKQRLFEVLSKLDKTFKPDDNAIERLNSDDVVYMELKESKFACGFCIFANESGYCKNKKVLAQVNLINGCCNLYYPKKKDVIEDKDWATNKK